jgi:hypothetical protein
VNQVHLQASKIYDHLPTAGPFTAAISSFSHCSSLAMKSPGGLCAMPSFALFARSTVTSFKSAPDEKAGPLAVRTTATTLASLSAASRHFTKQLYIASLKAFCLRGLFKVIIAVLFFSSTSYSTGFSAICSTKCSAAAMLASKLEYTQCATVKILARLLVEFSDDARSLCSFTLSSMEGSLHA